MRKKDPQKIDMGLRFRQAREEKGWTREQLAEHAELSVPFLADLELGNTGTSLENFAKLCRILNLSADYVLFGSARSSAQGIADLLRGRDEHTIHLVERTVQAILEALDKE